MQRLGDQCHHYWLLKDMARVTDVDLVRAFRDGRITSCEWAEMIDLCRACEWVDGCQSWLQTAKAPRPIPPHCRNSARLAHLKGEQELAQR
ncbi:DUF6455 family protein [Roseovarius gahaiensis]|uniref:DUF6455 family protein n=1 Tax=Roseovarius gahaiensis TaxID=2716691 RepID=UPI0038B4D5BE